MVETIILLTRALRKMAILRKIRFGIYSNQGFYRYSILPSLIAIAKRQDKHPIGLFETLFPEDWLPIKKIYNDSFQTAYLMIASGYNLFNLLGRHSLKY